MDYNMKYKKILARLCRYKLIPSKFHYEIYKLCKGSLLLMTRKLAFSDVKMLLNISDYIQFWIYISGAYELNFIKFLVNYLPRGGTFIDAGANVGSYTFNLASRMDSVIAVEASRQNASIIQATCTLNNLFNIKVYINALHNNDNETIDLYISPDTCGNNSLFIMDNCSRTESVNTITIDTICAENNIKDVRFIKIDIEGAEYFCLQGAINTIERDHPVILCELNSRAAKHAGYNLSVLADFFKDQSYYPFMLNKEMKLITFDESKINDDSFSDNIFYIYKKSSY